MKGDILINLAGATKEAQPPCRTSTWGITGNGFKIVETTRDMELIANWKRQDGQSSCGRGTDVYIPLTITQRQDPTR
jgi:hypothetical protein